MRCIIIRFTAFFVNICHSDPGLAYWKNNVKLKESKCYVFN